MLPVFVRGLTLGMVNIGNEKITFKDPVTGLMNIGKDFLNESRPLSEGVWVGKRPLDGKRTAFSSLLV